MASVSSPVTWGDRGPGPLKTQEEQGRRGPRPARGPGLRAGGPSHWRGASTCSLSALFLKKMHDAACTPGNFQHNCLKIAWAAAARFLFRNGFGSPARGAAGSGGRGSAGSGGGAAGGPDSFPCSGRAHLLSRPGAGCQELGTHRWGPQPRCTPAPAAVTASP